MSNAMHDRTIRGYEIVRRVPDKQREVYLAHRDDAAEGVVLVVAELEGSDAARLELEARRCLELESAAFSNVVDYFIEDGRHFVAFEHVEGTSLHRLMRYVDEQDERLGDGAVLHIGVGLLAALNVAHSAKTDDGKAAPIIHGQLGPHQVLISWEGVVKVMGFGLGVMFEKAGPPPSWLLPYVAPEVRDGRPHTSRANVYGAGAMLWTLLARQPLPEDGSRPRPLRKVRPDLPPSVTFPLDRALEPEAGKRISAKALQVGLTRAIEDADREELRWAMEVCRVRCTVEEEFLPQESLPPNQSGMPVSSSRSTASSPPDSDAPTGVTDQKQLLDAARLIGPLPWEQEGDAAEKPEPPRRNAGRPRPATRRRVGRKNDEDSVVVPRPGPPRPPKPSATDIIPTIPAPQGAESATGTLVAGVAPPVVEAAGSPPPSEAVPISYPPMPSGPSPSSAYPVAAGPAPQGYVHPSQYPPGVVYQGAPSSFAPGSVYPYPASAAPHMMPGLGFPMAPSQAPPAMPKLLLATVAVTAVASFLVGVLVSSGLELRFGDRAPAPPVTVTVPAPVPAPPPVTAAPTAEAPTPAPAPAPTAEPVAAAPEPDEATEEPEETPAEDEKPEEVSTEPIIATTDAAATLPAHKAHLLVHTDIKDAYVYVHGKLSGPTEEEIEVDCGMKFVRLGRSPNTGWLEPGRAFEIPCRTSVTVTIEPRPSYNWPRGQFLK